ncbi:photosynthetic NDH subunit of lumenal location 4, chloroplastic [Andrographis paniculata]|uniref:photosynthetic NDH subunit of lumenal location 4, chloroplastic n=1 Tax=Andrographis paniculata TaxID=175694 RepID=UPI0021E726AB|nr:photosynthetic NDH subunit of lumenal location 4, chloroplastic [Andrographis paniculata]
MATTSQLTLLAPNSRALPNFKSRSSSACSANAFARDLRKQLAGLAAGILAATAVAAASPLEAEATRIEYFATLAEPSCELSFVRSGLGYCDLVVGNGEAVPYSQLINVHYTARFADEIVFDSSYKRGRPVTMRLGVGKVIKGLDQGILGGGGVPPMHVGGKRKLFIPPHLAYGPEPAGCFSGDCNIPANATLLYDVNFVELYKGNRSK